MSFTLLSALSFSTVCVCDRLITSDEKAVSARVPESALEHLGLQHVRMFHAVT